MAWAGATGNQTPLAFHQAAGLWLLATAVGRRLYGEAPWGVRIYPNLYLMLVAGTTFYRKSTAYKLAESVARAAIPHMLMPTPGSPERFQEALAGRMPTNFDKLPKAQQERLTRGQPFAAQRGLLKDEVSGLFGAINKRDYMVGMKDLLMELYDCPDYFDKDTQTGLNVVENAALSILGVTTPASLGGWRERLYAPDRLVVSAAGAVDEDELLRLAETLFGHLDPVPRAPPLEPPIFTGGTAAKLRRLEQAHLVLLLPACGSA